jgi:creatinine amidohydrolase
VTRVGSTAAEWARTDREVLRRLLPEAVVVVPIGATEQHGPHLPTGTDALIAREVAWRAAREAAARSSRPFLVAPALAYGASDHHLPFGGTLSLTPATLLAVLTDLLRCVATQGGRRAVLCNGHGGNVGVCHAAAAAASATLGLAVAHLDYWRLAERDGGVPVPGHAGEFETSLVLAIDEDSVGRPAARAAAPEIPSVDGVDVHTPALWCAIDGYTDHPEKADAPSGQRRLAHVVAQAAGRLAELAEAL